MSEFKNNRPKALFAWELGYGLGHIGVVSPIAKRVYHSGFDCTIAGYLDKNSAALVPKFAKTIRTPPLLAIQRNSVSYAELLWNAGFHNVISSLSTVQAWIKIFQSEKPSVLLADLAPFAILAARIVGLPTVVIGSTFNLPPPFSPQPFLPVGKGGLKSPILESLELRTLHSINTILKMNNRPGIAAVHQMYDHAQAFLSGLPSLDHFDRDCATQPITYCGAIRVNDRGDLQAWPEGEGRRVFVHLRDSNSNTKSVLESVQELGCRLMAFIPQGKPFTTDRAIVRNTPFNLSAVASSADIAICQGNLSTSLYFIERGKYVLSSPETLEHSLTAHRIRTAGHGASIPYGASSSVVTTILTDCFSKTPSPLTDPMPGQEQALNSISDFLLKRIT